MKVFRKVEPNIYYQAEGFHIAANILSSLDAMKYRGSPFIVNAIFAVELYLKSLNGETVFDAPSQYCQGVTQYNKVFSKSLTGGHDLKILYKALSSENRSQIMQSFEHQITYLTAEDFFEKYNHHFVSWRYGFEGNAASFNSSEILVMLDTLKVVGAQYIQN